MVEKKTKEEPAAPALTDAASSSDPVVHQLIARRDTLSQHDRDDEREIANLRTAIDARAAAHADINAQLAELGYR